jgi:hypothetical protein
MEYSNQNGDIITNLPTNEVQLSAGDIQVIDSLFKNKSSDILIILKEFKDCFIFAFIGMLMFTPPVDILLARIVPISKTSLIINFCIKLLIATVLIWVVKNIFSINKC